MLELFLVVVLLIATVIIGVALIDYSHHKRMLEQHKLICGLERIAMKCEKQRSAYEMAALIRIVEEEANLRKGR